MDLRSEIVKHAQRMLIAAEMIALLAGCMNQEEAERITMPVKSVETPVAEQVTESVDTTEAERMEQKPMGRFSYLEQLPQGKQAAVERNRLYINSPLTQFWLLIIYFRVLVRLCFILSVSLKLNSINLTIIQFINPVTSRGSV